MVTDLPHPLPNIDHDLLVRLDERLKTMNESYIGFLANSEKRWAEVWVAIDDLRQSRDQGRGFLKGGQALAAFLSALPAGVIGYFIAEGK